MTHEPASPEVLVEVRGRLGLLTLNRPAAVNALTLGMVQTISATLKDWADDDSVATVAIVGAGDRGLCAGGDVVSLYRDVTTSDGMSAAQFWREEYAMNALIAAYPKPFVAIQDGLVLGGGIGVSAHGSHRVVTERSRLGFPEVTIGYIPDVGATWLLPRAPGELGTRLALSAETVGAADALLIGFADHFITSEKIPDLLTLLESEAPEAAIETCASDPPSGILREQQHWTDEDFAADPVAEVIGRLRNRGSEEALALAGTIEAKSPTALAVTLSALRRASRLPNLEAALEQEYRVSRHASTTHDFVEGIRAQLIDKDRSPRWNPASLAEVTDAEVQQYFAAPPEGDLHLQAESTLSKEAP